MAKDNKIEESQQLSQGVTLGTSGNADMTIPHPETKGGNAQPREGEGRPIPNQDQSSAANQQKADNSGQE